jgi:hypothetical protein
MAWDDFRQLCRTRPATSSRPECSKPPARDGTHRRSRLVCPGGFATQPVAKQRAPQLPSHPVARRAHRRANILHRPHRRTILMLHHQPQRGMRNSGTRPQKMHLRRNRCRALAAPSMLGRTCPASGSSHANPASTASHASLASPAKVARWCPCRQHPTVAAVAGNLDPSTSRTSPAHPRSTGRSPRASRRTTSAAAAWQDIWSSLRKSLSPMARALPWDASWEHTCPSSEALCEALAPTGLGAAGAMAESERGPSAADACPAW